MGRADALPAAPAGGDAGTALSVSVAYSPRAGVVEEIALTLAPGATLADALHASGLAARHPGLDAAAAGFGVWGALRDVATPLRDRDRVEVYRALQVDPKDARRRRDREQRKARATPTSR